jgi:hypothetical protein
MRDAQEANNKAYGGREKPINVINSVLIERPDPADESAKNGRIWKGNDHFERANSVDPIKIGTGGTSWESSGQGLVTHIISKSANKK